MWIALVFLGLAHAGDCDKASLKAAATEATPAAAARTWSALARCDAKAAKPLGAEMLERALPGSEASEALVLALSVGLDDAARAYLGRISSDERSKAIGYLGTQCATDPGVAAFFVSSHATLGETFWSNRWHRGLASCRTPEVRVVLEGALAGPTSGPRSATDRAQFFSVLEVYARNLRQESLPTLQELATKLDDPEEVTFVISAFGDAAGVGSQQGVDHESAKAVAQALTTLGPVLPPLAIEQGRAILLAVGDQASADGYVRYRWPAAWRNGGEAYPYAVLAIEKSTCSNGKKTAMAHLARFTEGGHQWPDDLGEDIEEKLTFEWRLDGSNLCSGDHSVSLLLPPEPFETEEAREAWIAEQIERIPAQTPGVKKTPLRKQPAFEM